MLTNIIQLQRLFDKYIYSLYDEASLIAIEKQEKYIETTLATENIYEFFDNKEEFYSNLCVYTDTIIKLYANDGYEVCKLVHFIKNEKGSIRIKHDPLGLRLYLYRHPDAEINNSYIKAIFIKSFERYKMKGDVLYSFLTKGYQYSCTPEELKKQLGINYINSMLKVKILSPAEKIVQELFDDKLIPFYFTINLDRSVMEPGNRIIRINFSITDNLVILRRKRLRPSYIDFIKSILIKIFPFNYPFIEEDIKKLDDVTVERIYILTRDIEKDPDFQKIDTATLIGYKLQHEYGIKIEKE